MRKVLLSLLIFSFCGTTWAKYKVCAATINSADEREVFKQYLPKDSFEFVELTDFSKNLPKDQRGSQWFNKACEAKVQCDVLLVSGHFGGSFFGDKGFNLSTNDLEKRSCKNDCKGILNKPSEVFLLGCNTLAEKKRDRRTPEEYLEVLLEDNIPRDVAERVVQSRYGALGSSFKNRMQRVFSGIPRIYGFDSIGPSGKTIRPFLHRYFKRIGNYEKHLAKIQSAEIIKSIEGINTSLNKRKNDVLASVLKNTAFTQCAGITEDDPAYKLKKQICQLYDANKPIEERIQQAHKMLKSDDYLLFMPSVASFFGDPNSSGHLFRRPEAKKAINKLQSDIMVKKRIQDTFQNMDGSPGIQIDILRMKKTLGFYKNERQFTKAVKQVLAPSIRTLDRGSLDIICSAAQNIEIEVQYEDFNPKKLRTPYGAAGMNCLKTSDKRIFKALMKNFRRKVSNAEEKTVMLFGATKIKGFDKELAQYARRNLNSNNEMVKKGAKRLLLFKGKNEEKNKFFRQSLGERGGPWEFQEAIKTGQMELSRESIDFALNKIQGAESNQAWAIRSALTSSPASSIHWPRLLERLSGIENLSFDLAIKEKVHPSVVNWAMKRVENTKAYEMGYIGTLLVKNKINKNQSKQLFANLEKQQATIRKLKPSLLEEKNQNQLAIITKIIAAEEKSKNIRYILRSQRNYQYSEKEEKLLRGEASLNYCSTRTEGSTTYSSCDTRTLPTLGESP